MTDFFQAIKEITARAAQEKCEKEIAEIKRNVVLAAENGLFSYTFYRQNVSCEQVLDAFPFFNDPVQMRVNCMCLDWSDPNVTSSKFYNQIVNITIDAQKEKTELVINHMKEEITSQAEKGYQEATFLSSCDFYDSVWKDCIAMQLPGFEIAFSKKIFVIRWLAQPCSTKVLSKFRTPA